MSFEGKEKRRCQRFELPGATVSYRRKRLFSSPEDADEEYCPVLDLSLGGLRFLSQKPLKSYQKIYLKVSVPDEEPPLKLEGQVIWGYPWPKPDYKYQIAVKFNPYGRRKGENSPETMARIKALEEKPKTSAPQQV